MINKTYSSVNCSTDWCMAFVQHCFINSNSTKKPKNFCSSYSCSEVVNNLTANNNFIITLPKNILKEAGVTNTQAYRNYFTANNKRENTSYIPIPGDVLFILNLDPSATTFNGSSKTKSKTCSTHIARHTGIVKSTEMNHGYLIITAIEGNVDGNYNTPGKEYWETSKVSEVQYIYLSQYKQFVRLNRFKDGNFDVNSTDVSLQRKILGFYPTSSYN